MMEVGTVEAEEMIMERSGSRDVPRVRFKKTSLRCEGVLQVLIYFYAATCPRIERIIICIAAREERWITVGIYTWMDGSQGNDTAFDRPWLQIASCRSSTTLTVT